LVKRAWLKEPSNDAQDAARGGQSIRVNAVTESRSLENITLIQWGWKERFDLARDDLIQATGSVDKILGGGRYQITLENDQKVTAQLSGRMRRFRIRVIPGDRVTVGLSPYDPTHGFITFRLKEGQSAPGK
jgi:translation initiation factor IF-1